MTILETELLSAAANAGIGVGKKHYSSSNRYQEALLSIILSQQEDINRLRKKLLTG